MQDMKKNCWTETLNKNPYHNVRGMCRKFPTCGISGKTYIGIFRHNLLMCRNNNYKQALNSSCTCKKYGDFAGIAISHTFSFLPALFHKLPAHAVTRSVGRTRDNKALLRDSGTPLIFAGQSCEMWDGML